MAPLFKHCSVIVSSLFLSQPVKTSLTPYFANSKAVAAPIPELPP